MTEYVVRFFLGGLVVSAFAILGDNLRPKSLAVCSVPHRQWRSRRQALPFIGRGAGYAALQSRAMTAGAIVLAIYRRGEREPSGCAWSRVCLL